MSAWVTECFTVCLFIVLFPFLFNYQGVFFVFAFVKEKRGKVKSLEMLNFLV